MTNEKLIKLFDSSRLHYVKDMQNMAGGNDLLKAIEILKNNIVKEVIENPKMCDEDIKKDIRFKLGVIYALDLVAGIPDNITRYLMEDIQ